MNEPYLYLEDLRKADETPSDRAPAVKGPAVKGPAVKGPAEPLDPSMPKPGWVDCPYGGGLECQRHGGPTGGALQHKVGGSVMVKHNKYLALGKEGKHPPPIEGSTAAGQEHELPEAPEPKPEDGQAPEKQFVTSGEATQEPVSSSPDKIAEASTSTDKDITAEELAATPAAAAREEQKVAANKKKVGTTLDESSGFQERRTAYKKKYSERDNILVDGKNFNQLRNAASKAADEGDAKAAVEQYTTARKIFKIAEESPYFTDEVAIEANTGVKARANMDRVGEKVAKVAAEAGVDLPDWEHDDVLETDDGTFNGPDFVFTSNEDAEAKETGEETTKRKSEETKTTQAAEKHEADMKLQEAKLDKIRADIARVSTADLPKGEEAGKAAAKKTTKKAAAKKAAAKKTTKKTTKKAAAKPKSEKTKKTTKSKKAAAKPEKAEAAPAKPKEKAVAPKKDKPKRIRSPEQKAKAAAKRKDTTTKRKKQESVKEALYGTKYGPEEKERKATAKRRADSTRAAADRKNKKAVEAAAAAPKKETEQGSLDFDKKEDPQLALDLGDDPKPKRGSNADYGSDKLAKLRAAQKKRAAEAAGAGAGDEPPSDPPSEEKKNDKDKKGKDKKKRKGKTHSEAFAAGRLVGTRVGEAAATAEAGGYLVSAGVEYGVGGAIKIGQHLLSDNQRPNASRAKVSKPSKKPRGSEVEQSSMKSLFLYLDLFKGAQLPNAGVSSPNEKQAKIQLESSYAKRPIGVANEGIVTEDEPDQDNRSSSGKTVYEGVDEELKFKDEEEDEEEETGEDAKKAFSPAAFLRSMNLRLKEEVRYTVPNALEVTFLVEELGHDPYEVSKGQISITGRNRSKFNEWACKRMTKSVSAFSELIK